MASPSKIKPDSLYDDSITFDDSDSSQNQGYSPRPGTDEGNGAQNFQSLDYFASNKPEGFKFDPSLSNFNKGFNDYSPRPGTPDKGLNTTDSPELAQLFKMIDDFTPMTLDISPQFKPFLPELTPSIGAIDAFIKVPRPDSEPDMLGLTYLDEPSIGQSNPQILLMQLKEKFGIVSSTNMADGYIGFIEDVQNNEKALNSFLDSIEETHRNRPPPSIIYTYKMPDLQELMDVWPKEMEQVLGTIPLPTADIDLSLEEYAKVICAILDIPVKGNIIESLHVLFSLLQQFQENQHFPSFSPDIKD